MRVKKLTVVSGKGGTGKTSISAALAYLAAGRVVVADCDVDAANLHLLLRPYNSANEDFFAGYELRYDEDKCNECGKCQQVCRFRAITNGKLVDRFSCEGCAVCVQNCPVQALSLIDRKCGKIFIADSIVGPLVHADLGVAVENSGKLVTEVRRRANDLAVKVGADIVIVDGPPGIGCPAIASITGSDLLLTVVEPTISAKHDLQRLHALIQKFRIPLVVCINKATISEECLMSIREWCSSLGIAIVAELPYDDYFMRAVQQGRIVNEFANELINNELSALWDRINNVLQSQ